jgi:hypothetical protein
MYTTVPEIKDPVFAKTSPKRSFCMTENEHFGLVFVKTGSINSGTVVIRQKKKQNNQNWSCDVRKLTTEQLQKQRLLFDKTHRLDIKAHIMYITLTTFFLFPQSSFADHLTLRECRVQICLLRILFPVVVFAPNFLRTRKFLIVSSNHNGKQFERLCTSVLIG